MCSKLKGCKDTCLFGVYVVQVAGISPGFFLLAHGRQRHVIQSICDPKYRSIEVASWEPEFAMLAVATLCSYIVCAGFVAPLFSDLWE